MRVVLDTVVFVRALINPYSWWGRLIFDHADRFELIVSPTIAEEYLAVLQRPELTRKYRSVATRDLQAVLDVLSAAIIVQPAEEPAISRDPADDKFLAAAHAGGADVIVTEDADLLDLRQYEQIAIITAETFLQSLEVPDRNSGREA